MKENTNQIVELYTDLMEYDDSNDIYVNKFKKIIHEQDQDWIDTWNYHYNVADSEEDSDIYYNMLYDLLTKYNLPHDANGLNESKIITSITEFKQYLKNNENYDQYSSILNNDNTIEIINDDAGLHIPIRKDDWMYPKEFIIFKIKEYTFALYKSTNFTTYKNKGSYYITSVNKIENYILSYWVESGRYGGISFFNIPEVKDNNQYGYFEVKSSDDLNKFINLFK
jgi:hypothetical protein